METSRKIEFYPEHPSDEKTHMIETTVMPILEQDKPFNVKYIGMYPWSVPMSATVFPMVI